jgi:hypothetical protein
MQSQDERDKAGFAARRQREGVAKEFSSDEVTGNYNGEELERRRAARPTDERLQRLETKHDELKRDVEKRHDELKKDVGDVRLDMRGLSGQVSDTRSEVSRAVGKLEGQEKVLGEMLDIVRKTHSDTVDRNHVKFTATVDVDRAKEMATVELNKDTELAKVEVAKEQQLDVIDQKKTKRAVLVKVLGAFGSGVGVVELLHKLGIL